MPDCGTGLMAVVVFMLLVSCLLAAVPARAGGPPRGAGSFYVSPEGSDAWSGRSPAPNRARSDGPFRTLKRAGEAVGPGDTCHVRAGVYSETLRPARSGAPGNPITFMNYEDETPVISGADPVTGWTREHGAVCSAPVAWDLGHQNQVFANGAMLTEARWPSNAGTLFKPTRAHVQSGTETSITDPKLPGKDDAWKGALVWCAGGAQWICWTARVTGYDAATHTLKLDRKKERWYRPKKGNPYVIMGLRSLLDAEGDPPRGGDPPLGGEWWFDRAGKRLHLWPPGGKDPGPRSGTGDLRIAMKRRMHAIDLAGRSHVRIVGIHFRGGGIRTDKDSSLIVLERLKGEYVGHSYEKDVSGSGAVLIHGRGIEVRSCEFAYASGSVVDLRGSDNRIVNCHIHHGNYGAKWRGTLGAAGRRQLIAYNTIRHSGRDLVNVHGLSESLVTHNDLSDAGWLTSDLGMIYGHNTDFEGTVFSRNLVHDNHARACSMGIYFDHLSHNVIVHHNIVWNVRDDPIRINNPSYYGLVYSNTCRRSGKISTFDHSRRQDLFGSRFENNIFNAPLRLPGHVATGHNLVVKEPALVAPARGDFAPTADSPARGAGAVILGIAEGGRDGKPDIGAVRRDEKPWRVGHDFARPPHPEPELERLRVAYMNVLRNGCFEREELEEWTRLGAGKAELVPGNGWGNGWGGGKAQPTGTSKRELRLGGGRDGVEQRVEGLSPRTRYRLSAWLKVSGEDESVSLGVRDFGGTFDKLSAAALSTSKGGDDDVSASTSSTEWVRKSVEFETGARSSAAVVYLMKTSAGPGHAWCDNIGLPLTPPVRGERGGK